LRGTIKQSTQKFSIIYLMRIEDIGRESSKFSYLIAFAWYFSGCTDRVGAAHIDGVR
jgi:hypothetical protein